jgi:hypothetical protein
MVTRPFSLGFDCRDVRRSALAGRWESGRRERFLLNPAIDRPISVDTSALPSLFPDFNDLADSAAPAVGCVPVEWESRALARSWPDLAVMVQVLRMHGIDVPGPDHLLLELVLHAGDGVADHPLWAGLLALACETTAAAALATSSGALDREFIGFDVADSSRTSALMNCGYLAREIDALRAHWSNRLNDRGLIVAMEDAQEFLSISNQRIPEHAPFAIFALHEWKSRGRE